MTESARPFKVWNFDRSIKKSITASSLQELLEKGCLKLGLDHLSQLTVVLEDDGTQVDEEDYFALLPGNSTFMFLLNGELWRPTGKGYTARDEPDYKGDSSNTEDEIHSVILNIKNDISNMITLSSEQLQQLVDCDTPVLAHLMGQTERYTRDVQAACQRHLDEHAQTKEAIDLLKLYHQVCESRASSNDQSDKKRKMDDSL